MVGALSSKNAARRRLALSRTVKSTRHCGPSAIGMAVLLLAVHPATIKQQDIFRSRQRGLPTMPVLHLENVSEDLFSLIERLAAADQVPLAEETIRLLHRAVQLNQPGGLRTSCNYLTTSGTAGSPLPPERLTALN